MPFPNTTIRNQARRRIAAQVRAGATCCFCDEPIDLKIMYPDPLAFTVDHRLPSSLGGGDEYEQLRPSHAHCNRERSNLPDGSVGRNSGSLDR